MKKHSTYARRSVFDSKRKFSYYSKLFLLMLGLTLSTEVAFSQTQFQSVFVEPSKALVSNDIYEVSDGYISCSGGGPTTIVIKTDLSGNLVWQRQFTLGGARIKPVPSGGYILAGGGGSGALIAVFKLDASGATEWTQSYTSSSPNYIGCSDILPTVDDGDPAYLIVGSYIRQFVGGSGYGEDVMAIKIDGTGSILWSRCYGRNTFEVGSALNEYGGSAIEIPTDPDNPDYLITARSDGYYGADEVLYVIKVTGTTGIKVFDNLYIPTTLSTVPYHNHGQSIAQDNSGNYGICGTTNNITVIDGSGAVQWSKNYSDMELQNIDAGPDNTGYILGCQYSFAEESALLKTSFAGAVSWSMSYGGFGQKVEATSDDGFILGGGIDVPAESQRGYLLVKTDDLGQSGCYETARTITPTTSPIQVIDLDGDDYSIVVSNGTTTESSLTCILTYDRGCEEVDDFTYASGGPLTYTVSESGFSIFSYYVINEADGTWPSLYDMKWTLIESGPTYTDVTEPSVPYFSQAKPSFAHFVNPTVRTDKTLCVDVTQSDGCRTRECFGRDPAYGYDFRTSETDPVNDDATNNPYLGASVSGVKNDVQLIPNPARDRVIISITGNEGKIEIVDINGTTLKQFSTTESSNEVDISQFKSGLYVVRVTQSDGVRVAKLQVF